MKNILNYGFKLNLNGFYRFSTNQDLIQQNATTLKELSKIIFPNVEKYGMK